jgi:hypothetical protein
MSIPIEFFLIACQSPFIAACAKDSQTAFGELAAVSAEDLAASALAAAEAEGSVLAPVEELLLATAGSGISIDADLFSFDAQENASKAINRYTYFIFILLKNFSKATLDPVKKFLQTLLSTLMFSSQLPPDNMTQLRFLIASMRDLSIF